MSYSIQLRRNGIYYFRKRVPADLISKIGKSEIIKSLKTSNRLDATKILPRIEIEVQDYLQSLRMGNQAVISENSLIFSKNKQEVYTLDYILQKWVRQNNPSESAVSEWNLTVKHFTEIFGKVSIDNITSKQISEFKDIICRVPARYSLLYPNCSIVTVYNKCKNADIQNLPSLATISKKITVLKSLLSFAKSEGLIETNVAAGIKIKGSRQRELKRECFTSEQLSKIFTPELEKQNNHRFWIPFIALYSGMRLEEIGQMMVSDVRQEGNIYYFDINDNDDKNLKTKTSIRKIPIHKNILEKNFLKYVETIRNSGTNRLFPELLPSKCGKLTKEFSRWFGRYLASVGIDDKSLVFHSFRHGFKTALRAVECPEDISDCLTGHSSASIGRSYGNGYSIEVLNKWAQRIKT